MIVTIDGPSGTGKSTVAKEVANRLGISFFDTGAMYRSFAWMVLNQKIDPSDEEKVCSLIPSFSIDIREEKRYYVEGEEVTEAIRSREVTTASSQIAAYRDVRKYMVKLQREFGKAHNAVFEGRDMGTVVFPEADLKIFLTASEETRAKRRFHELKAKGVDVDFSKLSKEMQARDANDSSRETSPLKRAKDAALIDTSHLTTEEVVNAVLKSVPKKRMKLVYFLIYFFARAFFKLFYRLKIYGDEKINPGAGILIANHTSFYDPPILSISCPEEVHFLARESLFRIPFLGWLIKVLNTHPLSKGASDLKILRQMVGLLGERKKLIIFPEGTRSKDGELKPFKKGFVFLAKKAKCTIYPAYIDGAHSVWPPGKKFPKLFGKVTCAFGTPIRWQEFQDLPKDKIDDSIAERCSKSICALKDWLEKGGIGDPP